MILHFYIIKCLIDYESQMNFKAKIQSNQSPNSQADQKNKVVEVAMQPYKNRNQASVEWSHHL